MSPDDVAKRYMYLEEGSLYVYDYEHGIVLDPVSRYVVWLAPGTVLVVLDHATQTAYADGKLVMLYGYPRYEKIA